VSAAVIKKAAFPGGLRFLGPAPRPDQRLAAIALLLAAALAASAPATALALLMLSIGAEAVPTLADELMSGALAALADVSTAGGVFTSSFLLQPPSASCEARATARVRDSDIERFMADSSELSKA
jgi:hypothetical protein